jgi:hypothetical protein
MDANAHILDGTRIDYGLIITIAALFPNNIVFFHSFV